MSKQRPTPGTLRHKIGDGIRKAVKSGTIPAVHAATLYIRHIGALGLPNSRVMYHDLSYPGMLGSLAASPGMTVHDGNGKVTARFNKQFPYVTQGALGLMLREADRAGHITRDIKGKRGYKITLTPEGLAYIGGPPGPVPDFWVEGFEPGGKYRTAAPAQTAGPTAPPVGDARLQRAVLSLAADKTRLEEVVAQQEQNIQALIARLTEANDEITRLRALVPASVPVPTNGTGTTIGERLSPAEAADLERIMQEIPAG